MARAPPPGLNAATSTFGACAKMALSAQCTLTRRRQRTHLPALHHLHSVLLAPPLCTAILVVHGRTKAHLTRKADEQNVRLLFEAASCLRIPKAVLRSCES